ncbi:metal-dependent hydrolase [Mycobacterium celatum]|uniref:Metal-dependent hydrolase n=1 Tax=Mycobacterium celatum TaxID=28045 RepID=A0A1X1RLG8_MYCCE|nr:metal-dependent hydrolase [Mycobacterium celatum]ORV08624.1 metal-dependent hydrolase [Mycobacterium celatum]PIB78382.1 metal-dependent hydrolase [Mycobacterium celatum]
MGAVQRATVESVSARTYPPVRRIRFRFGDPQPMKRHFVEGDIVLSHLTALLSAIFPPGEEGFIRSVRRFADQVTDPVLKKRVAGFIGQESVHGQEHRRLNEQLVAKGYPLVRLFMFDHDSRRHKLLLRYENRLPGYLHLAMTAAAEHYTATLAQRMLTDEMQAIPGDPEVRHLLNWHAIEELEHKSVAFDVYRAVGGPEWIRIGVMAVIYVLTIPVVTGGVALSIMLDPTGWRPITVLRQTIGVFRGPLLKGLMADLRKYMRPGFHPDDIDTSELLERWRRELFGTEGALVDHLK